VRQLSGVVFAFALLAGASVVAVQRFGDRELFVPPPDAVAEGFFRAVTSRRPAQAQPFLRDRVPVADLVALRQSIETRIRRVHDVQTETIARTGQKAQVRVHLKAEKASETLTVSVVWNGKEWKIEGF
jgi:hypothetical protein